LGNNQPNPKYIPLSHPPPAKGYHDGGGASIISNGRFKEYADEVGTNPEDLANASVAETHRDLLEALRRGEKAVSRCMSKKTTARLRIARILVNPKMGLQYNNIDWARVDYLLRIRDRCFKGGGFKVDQHYKIAPPTGNS
jgi:hypothetical protein